MPTDKDTGEPGQPVCAQTAGITKIRMSSQNTRASSPSEATEHEGLAGKKEKENKKKKKGDVERDALGRRPLLTHCEVRGEPVVGEKLTAFAKVRTPTRA